MKEIVFDIYVPGEIGAGLRSVSDTVIVRVLHDPGGLPGEFEEHVRQALLEWYDGGAVKIVSD